MKKIPGGTPIFVIDRLAFFTIEPLAVLLKTSQRRSSGRAGHPCAEELGHLQHVRMAQPRPGAETFEL